jgi:chromosomal replication initiation ATPase DnaA
MTEPRMQFAFEFPAAPRHAAEDFLISASNEAAYALIETWRAWPGGMALLVGAAGSGKSHLGAIFAAQSHAWTVKAAEITGASVAHLSSQGALLAEDMDRGSLDEDAWFHLLNRLRARGACLLMTARMPARLWPISTPDLVSRLRLAPETAIGEPDEALLRAVAVKLFIDRQLMVDTAVIEAIVRRCERTVPAVQEAVRLLDQAALAAGRRLTPAFVAQYLAATAPEEPR